MVRRQVGERDADGQGTEFSIESCSRDVDFKWLEFEIRVASSSDDNRVGLSKAAGCLC